MNKRRKPHPGRPTPNWPPEKIAKFKKLYPKFRNELVATKMRITLSAVKNAAARYRVRKNNNHYWDKPWEDFILKNWPVMSCHEIVEGLNKKFKIAKTFWAVINKYMALTRK